MNRPRGLFTREGIRRQLWGDDTFVDYELGIDYCLSSIHSALHDKPGAPHYVETAPRRGYQFIAPVARVRAARSQSWPSCSLLITTPTPQSTT
ncbi:MAG: hypothetical protein LAO23_17825 [Acidobacteriia bacterium]|nr:hypothetical protein [Terriglobia bacterium]